MFQSLFRLSDTALNTLLTFLAMFFRTLSKRFVASPQSFISRLPLNMRSIHTNSKSNFRKYVCCPTCQSIYSWDQCILKLPTGRVESKRCSFVRFPNHPQVQHRKPCDTVLMKEVKSSAGKVVLYPKLIYCYKSIVETLQEMLNRPDFSVKCEAWRTRSHQDGVYNDEPCISSPRLKVPHGCAL